MQEPHTHKSREPQSLLPAYSLLVSPYLRACHILCVGNADQSRKRNRLYNPRQCPLTLLHHRRFLLCGQRRAGSGGNQHQRRRLETCLSPNCLSPIRTNDCLMVCCLKMPLYHRCSSEAFQNSCSFADSAPWRERARPATITKRGSQPCSLARSINPSIHPSIHAPISSSAIPAKFGPESLHPANPNHQSCPSSSSHQQPAIMHFCFQQQQKICAAPPPPPPPPHPIHLGLPIRLPSGPTCFPHLISLLTRTEPSAARPPTHLHAFTLSLTCTPFRKPRLCCAMLCSQHKAATTLIAPHSTHRANVFSFPLLSGGRSAD